MSYPLTPITEPFPDDIAPILSRYPQIDGYILSLFRTFANSRRFLEKGVPNLLDKDSPLPLRIREIVILRVTALRNCEYEWGVHVSIFGKAADLSEAQIAGTCAASTDAALWSSTEARLLAVIDELCSCGMLSEQRRMQFQTDWTTDQQLEILALCGAYQTISFVANVAALPPEAFAEKFPRHRPDHAMDAGGHAGPDWSSARGTDTDD